MEQQQKHSSSRPVPPKPPEPRVATVTVKLIAHNGLKWDDIQLRADKNLPQVLIVGIGTGRRVFLRHAGSMTYNECSWVEPRLPEFVPM